MGQHNWCHFIAHQFSAFSPLSARVVNWKDDLLSGMRTSKDFGTSSGSIIRCTSGSPSCRGHRRSAAPAHSTGSHNRGRRATGRASDSPTSLATLPHEGQEGAVMADPARSVQFAFRRVHVRGDQLDDALARLELIVQSPAVLSRCDSPDRRSATDRPHIPVEERHACSRRADSASARPGQARLARR